MVKLMHVVIGSSLEGKISMRPQRQMIADDVSDESNAELYSSNASNFSSSQILRNSSHDRLNLFRTAPVLFAGLAGETFGIGIIFWKWYI